jgi:hypothetical protein
MHGGNVKVVPGKSLALARFAARLFRLLARSASLVSRAILLSTLTASALGQNSTLSVVFAPYQARLRHLILEEQKKGDTEQLHSDQHLLSAIDRFIQLSPFQNLHVTPKHVYVHAPGYGNAIDFHVNRLVWLQSLWQPIPKPQIALAEYLAYRELDDNFDRQLHAVLISDAFLRDWDARVEWGATRTRKAVENQDAVDHQGFSPAKRTQLSQDIDLFGKYRELQQIVNDMLTALDKSPGNSGAWAPLQSFLKSDIEAQLQDAVKKQQSYTSSGGEIVDNTKTYWYGLKNPPEMNHLFERLVQSGDNVATLYSRFEQRALSPYQTPFTALQDPLLRDYLDADMEWGSELVDLLNMPEMTQDSVSVLIAMFNPAGFLLAQASTRIAGRHYAAVDALKRVVVHYVSARLWDNEKLFDDSRAMTVINYFDDYLNGLVDGGTYELSTSWGIKDLTWDARDVWHIGGWAEWRWLGLREHDSLVRQNRLIEFEGSFWLLPEGTTGGKINSGQDLLTARAQFVEVALDDSARMYFALEDHWITYLKGIQSENNYRNWSGPPYDLYRKRRSH